ncbi:MAG: hypothetical protein WCT07_04005 [Candidatus Paceibacterota bacterium]
MEARLCPFCKRKLEAERTVLYTDYFCNRDDHFFSERLSDVKDDYGKFIIDENGKCVKELTKVKLSLRDHSGEKMYLKINYDEGTSQVWTKNSKTHRHIVNSAIIPNYDDKESIIRKIKTLILFS